MSIRKNILEAIGGTPLVRLNKVVEPGMAEVVVKCEFMNPTGSIKDRMACWIIERAERDGSLKPGGTIVENTSGNTGLGVAMTAAVKGYRCVFTIPDKMSKEKIDMLKAYGVEVVITPTDVPGDSPDHYVETAKRIARETPGAFYVNQYHSAYNIEAHYRLTGPEIWEQTDGRIDAFVAGAGTGGTISGTARFLKEKNPAIKVVGVDPLGSIHYHYFHTKTLGTPYVYKVEGLGEDILCEAMDYSVVDDFEQVSDKDCFTLARRLVREEGLFCGGSSGGNVHVALKVARELGPGKRVVTVLPDSATRYITKYLADSWMKDHGFAEPGPDLGLVEDLLAGKPAKELVTAREGTKVAALVGLMRRHGVSQVPIVDGTGKPVGIVHEIDLLRGLHSGEVSGESPVDRVSHAIGGLVYPKARIEELFRLFETDLVAVVVDAGAIVGIVSQIDLIEFLSKKRGE